MPSTAGPTVAPSKNMAVRKDGALFCHDVRLLLQLLTAGSVGLDFGKALLFGRAPPCLAVLWEVPVSSHNNMVMLWMGTLEPFRNYLLMLSTKFASK